MTRQNEEMGRADGGGADAWSILRWSAVVAFAIALLACVVSLATNVDPRFKTMGALGTGGLAVLRGMVAYGAWQRQRWAIWAGGVMAALTLVAVPVVMLAQVSGAGWEVSQSPASMLLGAAQGLANLVLLVGVMLLLSRRR